MLKRKNKNYFDKKGIVYKIKDLVYLVKVLLFPFLLTIVSTYFVIKFDILKELALDVLKIDLSKIIEKIFSAYPNHDKTLSLICAAVVFIALNIAICNIRIKNKCVFLKNRYDINGDYCPIIYKIASLSGYKSINMIGRPIPVQYKILASNCFDEFISGIIEENDSPISINYSNKENKNYETINLIIGDTYKIKAEDIPDFYKNFFTIIATKNNIDENNGKREYNNSFISTLGIELHKYEPENKTINIFAYTNPKTNEELYKKVFVRKNNRLLLNVFYTDEKFLFLDEKVSIKL